MGGLYFGACEDETGHKINPADEDEPMFYLSFPTFPKDKLNLYPWPRMLDSQPGKAENPSSTLNSNIDLDKDSLGININDPEDILLYPWPFYESH